MSYPTSIPKITAPPGSHAFTLDEMKTYIQANPDDRNIHQVLSGMSWIVVSKSLITVDGELCQVNTQHCIFNDSVVEEMNKAGSSMDGCDWE
ncbi:MAG: hypothetical protein JKX76_01465 [Colwellia sp.]|nr:hypothetical protein [Colwellia sp.]